MLIELSDISLKCEKEHKMKPEPDIINIISKHYTDDLEIKFKDKLNGLDFAMILEKYDDILSDLGIINNLPKTKSDKYKPLHFITVKPKYHNKWTDNLSFIDFKAMVLPSLIVKHKITIDNHLQNKDILDVFEFLFKEMSNYNKNIQWKIKSFLFATCSKLMYNDDINLILQTERNNILRSICIKFKNMVYIDTLGVYFHNLFENKQKVIEYINQYILEYTITDNMSGIFEAPLKYIVIDKTTNTQTIKGFKTIT